MPSRRAPQVKLSMAMKRGLRLRMTPADCTCCMTDTRTTVGLSVVQPWQLLHYDSAAWPHCNNLRCRGHEHPFEPWDVQHHHSHLLRRLHNQVRRLISRMPRQSSRMIHP